MPNTEVFVQSYECSSWPDAAEWADYHPSESGDPRNGGQRGFEAGEYGSYKDRLGERVFLRRKVVTLNFKLVRTGYHDSDENALWETRGSDLGQGADRLLDLFADNVGWCAVPRPASR